METPPGDKTGEQPGNKEKPVKAATLRQNYDTLKKDFEGLQGKLKALEAERNKPADPKDHPEYKKVSETLTAREKRLAELEDEMRFTNFEKSGEYKEQYWGPFAEAYEQGRNKVSAFRITDESGQPRQGTAEDFDALMRITDDDAAADFASDLFGNKAPSVMYHREKVQELNNRRIKAIEDFRKQGGEREKTRTAQQQKTQQEMAAQWEAEKKAGVEKFPHWFKPEDGDEKGNGLLERGFALADAAFGAELKDPKTGEVVPLGPQEMVKLHSAIRNKAAGFDRLAYKHNLAKQRITALEKELQAFKDSEPTPGETGRKPKQGGGSAMDEADAALQKLAR